MVVVEEKIGDRELEVSQDRGLIQSLEAKREEVQRLQEDLIVVQNQEV